MNRRKLIAGIGLIVAMIGSAALGVAADRVLVEDDDVDEDDPIRDAWTTQEGRAVVSLDPEADADWIAIADGRRVLIAVEPPASHIMSMPLEVREKVSLPALNDSRADIAIPAAAVRGESVDGDPMDPGHYQVLAIENGSRVDSMNLTVEPAAVPDSGDDDG